MPRTFLPLNKAGHGQLLPQWDHLLVASSLTRQEVPTKNKEQSQSEGISWKIR